MDLEKVTCKLCQSGSWYIQGVKADQRSFYQCSNCYLIQVAPEHLPDLQDEKALYDTHQNGPGYLGYLDFLNRAVRPMLPYLNKNMKGLDYGCGPGPAISYLLDRKGIGCEDYDPIYFPIPFKKKYDFLFATECFEHFHYPFKEIEKMDRLLKPKGMIGIMTETFGSAERFKNWYYIKDYTHVIFFHQKTFEWIAREFSWEMIHTDHHRVFIFKKNAIQTI